MSNMIGDILNDIRSVVEKSQTETRQYNKTSNHVYKPDQARFKLVIWFKDGNKRSYYSYDNQYHDKKKHVDEQNSLVKLCKLMQGHAGKYKNAIIYATLDPERKTNGKYTHIICFTNILGNTSWNKATSFLVDNRDNLLHLKKLEMYSNKEHIAN
jgi:hypothetical protein